MSALSLVHDGTRSGRPLPSQAGTAAALRSVPEQQRSLGEGRLSATFKDGRTRVDTLYQQGCAKLRLPSPHGASALDAVMINTSGGMTGGDRLSWHFGAGAGCDLTVTTQACEKIYKSVGGSAQTDISLTADEGARLWWLPQETILFDNADFSRRIDVRMAPNAEAVLVEAVLFGRAAMGEAVRKGRMRDRWRVHVADRLVHAEDFFINGNICDKLTNRATGNGNQALATILVVTPVPEARLDGLRTIVGGSGGVSAFDGKLVVRLLAADGYGLRKILNDTIGYLRADGTVPRVWQT